MYPRELRRTLIPGISNQLRSDGEIKPGCFGVQPLDEEHPIREHMCSVETGFPGTYVDDMTPQVLNDSMVLEAQQI